MSDKDGLNYASRGEFYLRQYLRNKNKESLKYAYEDLIKAIEFENEKIEEAYYWIGKYYEAVGDTEKYTEYYDKAIKAGFDESELD